MSVSKAKLLSRNRITIPAPVRKALELRKGDTVVFEVIEGGFVHLTVERQHDPLGKYAGALRQGQGKSLDTIVRELREERGHDSYT